MKVTGRVCNDCGVFKPFEYLVKNAKSKYDREKLCKVCYNIKNKPRTTKRDLERKRLTGEAKQLREETLQVEIEYYSKQEAKLNKAGLNPWSEAGVCDKAINPA